MNRNPAIVAAILAMCLGLPFTAARAQDHAAEPDTILHLGVAWQGESHMQDRLSAGLAEVLEQVAPQIEVEWRRALPSQMALDQTAREFQSTKDAMVLLRSTGAMYLGNNPPAIPAFIGGCNNPVTLGAVENLENPGGMITGVTYFLSHHDVIKTFKAILPGLESILLIYQVDHPGGAIDRVGVKAACEEFEIEYHEEGCRTHSRRQDIIRRRAGTVSAILLINNSVVADFPVEAVAAAGDTPVLGYTKEIVEGGALAALSADDTKLGRFLAMSVVDVMVNGALTDTMRVQTDDYPIMHINMDTAVRLGVQVPQAVLKTAQIVHDNDPQKEP